MEIAMDATMDSHLDASTADNSADEMDERWDDFEAQMTDSRSDTVMDRSQVAMTDASTVAA